MGADTGRARRADSVEAIPDRLPVLRGREPGAVADGAVPYRGENQLAGASGRLPGRGGSVPDLPGPAAPFAILIAQKTPLW